MKILFLTFYYSPDLCAGSFRNTALAEKLSSMLMPGDSIDVLTTMPNRYPSYRVEAKHAEINGNLTIRRINIPEHAINISGQIRSFRKYFNTVLDSIKGKTYDIVYASSSRLFTAYLGTKVASELNIPLYLDVRDLFTETMGEVINNGIIRNALIPVLRRIEYRTFSSADHINVVSEGFLPYMRKFGCGSFSSFTNGIDEEFLAPMDIKPASGDVKVITYAGNIGEGQGLEKIIPEAARLLRDDYKFRIIGDGGTRKLLEAAVNKAGLTNVEIIPPVGRKELIEYYGSSDFLFIHLNDYRSFESVLPSKLFEYCAFDVPIIAGLSGYPKHFVEINVDNHILFSPGNAFELAQKLINFEYRRSRRTEFIGKYSRDSIMKEMAKSVIECACSNSRVLKNNMQEELV